MSGYVRIHRTLLGHSAFRNESETMAFAWLVAKAAWRPTRVRYKGHSINLGRGQVAISQRDMAAAFDRDKAWIARLIQRLKSEAMIEARLEAGVTLITICKYAEYQADGASGEAADEAPDEAGNEAAVRQRRGTEQGIEEIKRTPIAPKGPGKTFLPSDWVPPDAADLPPQAAACAAQWSEESYARHGEAFVSYWQSARKKMTDWRLTWANRIISLHAQVIREQSFASSPGRQSADSDQRYLDHMIEDRRLRDEWQRRNGDPPAAATG